MRKGDLVTWEGPTGSSLVGRISTLYASGWARLDVLHSIREDGSLGLELVGVSTKRDQDDLSPYTKPETVSPGMAKYLADEDAKVIARAIRDEAEATWPKGYARPWSADILVIVSARVAQGEPGVLEVLIEVGGYAKVEGSVVAAEVLRRLGRDALPGPVVCDRAWT